MIMSTQAPSRPGSVSLVVFLTWLVALVTVASGVALLVGSEDWLVALGVNASRSTTTGWIFIVLGLVIALFASALGKGSGFARLIISLLMMFRFVLGVIAVIVTWGTSYVWGAMLMTLVALVVLYLLWNARASAWFASR